MTSSEADAILAEAKRRGIIAPPQFVDPAFEKQAAFIAHPARQKSALTTRRAGKSYGDGLYLFKEAAEHPGVQCLYVGLTRLSAKYIMWEPVIKKINKRLSLGADFNSTELTATLPNGSVVRLAGADANQEEMEKLLGQANRLVIVDECASFKPHIRKLIVEVLKPTLIDHRGTLCLTGTPGDVPAGFFFDVTTGIEPGWERFEWSTEDNPYMVEQWREEIALMVEANPGVVDTPGFKRHYLKQWVVDSDDLVYKFKAPRNVFERLPEGRWHYGLGIDLGWNDPTAFTLGAWSAKSPKFHVLESWKRAEMQLDDIAAQIRAYDSRHGLVVVVVDNASKQSVEHMREKFSIPFKAAEKAGKTDFIGVMNADMVAGNVAVAAEGCDQLIEEWQNGIWDKRALEERQVRIEDPRNKNHNCDSALYLFREAKHWLFEAAPEIPKVNTPEWSEYQEKQMIEAEERAFAAQEAKPWWKRH